VKAVDKVNRCEERLSAVLLKREVNNRLKVRAVEVQTQWNGVSMRREQSATDGPKAS
jgi:hypothetical protein